MEITQKVIDVAKARLPKRPEPGTDVLIIVVADHEVGIGSEHDKERDWAEVKFVWDIATHNWLCMTLIEVDEPRALNVVELKPATKEPGDNVVQRLEQALELARKGEIANIAMVAVCNDGDVMDCWANQSNALTMVGGLESLKFEFMNGVIEKR
ncbi:hypothetical protein VPH219E481_0091 [Vibrio phage 219E48-1]|nr:hypothetical protein PODOV021v1_p0077 [Vibrio phage 219E41.2]QZI91056.1 hypothetical protein PODOV032v1_p0051 [Vibrio phage 219E41.1]QZI91126.1 hypothetical protein PODOV060v1_p0032 [Vibrio phage 234P8]QZI91580.1 hypothetical protein PODOV087v1_p0075 [Vibrio phage 431E45.1]QZI91636.1 hypothetical protein PODOV086v1_p0052 [Vibrio phage 431E46.1]QZI91669.1 hypothetical protein PODOV088v1_p0008 [Vibrio phage 431E48.2]